MKTNLIVAAQKPARIRKEDAVPGKFYENDLGSILLAARNQETGRVDFVVVKALGRTQSSPEIWTSPSQPLTELPAGTAVTFTAE